MRKNQVILVNEQDLPQGFMDKMEVHRKGLLHRAISVFIFNNNGEMLLQKRASGKYHSAGLWTNTCCSHPLPGEATVDAAHRRLREEMNLKVTLKPLLQFQYTATFDNGLIEHELDHVYFGLCDDNPTPDPLEAEAWKYIDPATLQMDISLHPNHYTEWFKICLEDVLQFVLDNRLVSLSQKKMIT